MAITIARLGRVAPAPIRAVDPERCEWLSKMGSSGRAGVSVRRHERGQGAGQATHVVEVQYADPFGRDSEAMHIHGGQLIAPPIALFLTEVSDGRCAVLGGVLAERCAGMLRNFFLDRRAEGKK